MIDVAIRRLQGVDSWDELTGLLHRAFEPMHRRGLRCQSGHQTAATTRQRAARGDCFVAVADRVVVGTITLQPPDAGASITHYRSPDVASVHQFAVEPACQGAGVGHAMLQMAGSWAAARQFRALSLDTPACATDLRAWYARQGFALVEIVHVAGRAYESAVMTRPVGVGQRAALAFAWPARHPAEMARLARRVGSLSEARPSRPRGPR